VRHNVDAVPVLLGARNVIFAAAIHAHARRTVLGPALQNLFKDNLCVLPAPLPITTTPQREGGGAQTDEKWNAAAPPRSKLRAPGEERAARFTIRGNSGLDPGFFSGVAAAAYSRYMKISRTRPTSIRSPSLSLVRAPISAPLTSGTRSPRPR
jgi:hypothetical protein